MEIKLLGIDLAKNSFQIHGADSRGKAVLRKKLGRREIMEFVANLPECTIAMEACGSANYWGTEFERFGHTVKLIAPQFVKPFVKSNKNDSNDAEAIVEAASRPQMRFVRIKSPEKRDIQLLHTNRARLVRDRTSLMNAIHALLLEYGLAATGAVYSHVKFRKDIQEIATADTPPGQMTGDTQIVLKEMIDELSQIDAKVAYYTKGIENLASQNEDCKRLQTIPGIGPITATAILAVVPSVHSFKNGRELSAWLGLVPKQCSTGGKSQLLGISKRGDPYLRSLLVHGARSVLRLAPKRTDMISKWAIEKKNTRGTNRAIVALANKNARIVFRVLKDQKEYAYKM